MTRFVYLMRRADGAWKVGCSSNPEERRKGLRSRYGVSFCVIAVWPRLDAWLVEAAAHDFLIPHRDLACGKETYWTDEATVMAGIKRALSYGDSRRPRGMSDAARQR